MTAFKVTLLAWGKRYTFLTLTAQRWISQASNSSAFLPPFHNFLLFLFWLLISLLILPGRNHETSQWHNCLFQLWTVCIFFRLSHRMMEFHHGICTHVCLYHVLSFSATTTIEFSSEGWRDGRKITSSCWACRRPGLIPIAHLAPVPGCLASSGAAHVVHKHMQHLILIK